MRFKLTGNWSNYFEVSYGAICLYLKRDDLVFCQEYTYGSIFNSYIEESFRDITFLLDDVERDIQKCDFI